MGVCTLINLDRLAAGKAAIAADMKTNLQALRDSVNNVEAAQLAAGSVTEAKLATGSVSAAKLQTDAVETAKIKALNVTTAKLAASVLSADATGRGKMADGFLTAAKLAASSGIMYAETGSYSGTGSSNNEIDLSGAFKPDLILILREDSQRTFLAARVDSTADVGDLRALFSDTTPIGSTFEDAMQYDADGFTLVKTDNFYNASGVTYYYVAIKFA